MKNPLEPSQAIQRVKVGMTGLASVILLIALASAVLSSASREPPVTTTGAKPTALANPSGSGDNSIDTAKEPLAELGVAPSTTLESLNTTGAAPPPAATAPAPTGQPR